MASAPGWYPDPVGTHDLRYHNGQNWTGDVSTDGVRMVAPLPQATPPASAGRSGRRSLVAGIVAMTIAWIPFVCVLGLLIAVVAIVAGRNGRRDPASAGPATAGIITGSVAVVFAIGGFWLSALIVSAVDGFENPGDYQTAVTSCSEVDGMSQATGTITNQSNETRDYLVTVEFSGSQTVRVAVDDVAPGDTADFTATEDLRFDELECIVSEVTGPLPFGLDVSG